MLASFERLAGARLALRSGDHNLGALVSHISKQRRAISHNALVAGDEIRVLKELRVPLNRAYLAVLKRAGITPGERIMSPETNRSDSRWDALQDRLSEFLSRVNDTDSIRKILLDSDAETPVVCLELLDDRWDKVMDAMASSLYTFTSKPRMPRRLYEES